MKSILKDEKGQNIVEFALVVPLLFLLVIGIAEFGRAWMTRNVLTGAAREAARIAVVPQAGGASSIPAAITRANDILASAGITAATVTVTDNGAFGAVTATVVSDFNVVVAGFLPGLDSPTIQLTSTTTMRREY
jgi:Flp pilus assembly protein TadG